MFFPESQVRVWLYNRPTDMRKSYDGLSALVKNKLKEDPLSGQLFVFINRKGKQCKVLYFDRSGYCIWSKRLEQGQFHTNAVDSIKQTLSLTDLKLIIEGIDTRSVRQHKRYCKSYQENHKTQENRLQ
jgi:transposase